MNNEALHKSVTESISDWPRLQFAMDGIETSITSFKTSNLKKDKKGFFEVPTNKLTLIGEAEYSTKMFSVLVGLGDEIDIDFGFDYGNQIDSINGGIKGIIHWYICQWFKTGTLTNDSPIKTMPLKAVYEVEGRELFLGSVMRLLFRKTGFADYAQLGQIICTYVEWCKAKKELDFEKLDQLASTFFALGNNMAKATHEREIIAGKSRTDNASDSKGAEGKENKERLKKLLPDAIKHYRDRCPKAKKVNRSDVFRFLEKRSGLAFSSIKRHLGEIDFDNM